MPDHIYLGLLHYPVYDRGGSVVATAVTNLDIHDISRLARTYGIRRYFLITPLASQREMAERLINYWTSGDGASHNPLRMQALSVAQVVTDLHGAEEVIRAEQNGKSPIVVATTARSTEGAVGYEEMRERMARDEDPFLILLGTGWGIEEHFLKKTHCRLAPITGSGAYNHLSVRSAAAIIADRLLGDRKR